MFTVTPYRVRAVIALACLIASTACRESESVADLPPLHDVQSQLEIKPSANAAGESLYQLRDSWYSQRGDTLQMASLAGRVRVVAMVYTNCHATCPLIISDMKRIEASLTTSERKAVGFVLVSLDPARDTPARLTEWANSLDLDTTIWTLLSGNDQSVRAVSVALDVRYQPQPNGELAHTNGLAVLDRDGTIVHQQVGLGETPASIRSVKSLLQ